MANEYTWPRYFDLSGLLQPETGYLEGIRGERGSTMRTYDQLMIELHTMKSARSEVNSKAEQLLDIYSRIAKKCGQNNPKVLPFLNTG